MNKKQYAEFHKYLALLYYEYIKANNNYNLSEECRKANDEIIESIQKIMICVVIGEDE